jgi:putative ABC transport system substrate-binding protein
VSSSRYSPVRRACGRSKRAQQSAIPVIGFLSSASPKAYAGRVACFRKGLNESGYIDGQNATIEFRWAQGQYDRLPVFAADLVQQKVAVIVSSGGDVAALSAKAATSSIPIVTVSGSDPVKAGLVASFNRPGGNVTGASFVATELETKRLEILRDVVPTAAEIGVLINPSNPAAESRSRDLQMAARTLERNIHIVSASSENDVETAFATLIQQGADALLISTDSFFTSQRDRLVGLAATLPGSTVKLTPYTACTIASRVTKRTVRSRTSANVISARVDPEPTAAKRGKPTLAPPRPLRRCTNPQHY